MKKIVLVSLLAITSLTIFSCGSDCCKKTETNSTEQQATPSNNGTAMYECPMKCEPATANVGKCGKCGMDLVAVKK